MKVLANILLITFLSFTITTSCTSSSEEAKVEKPAVEADSETKLAIEGMMCMKGCVGLISKSLTAMHGVGEFDINFDEAYAEINYDSKQVSESEIIAMINKLADESYKASPYSESEDEEDDEETEIEVEVGEDKGSHLMKP